MACLFINSESMCEFPIKACSFRYYQCMVVSLTRIRYFMLIVLFLHLSLFFPSHVCILFILLLFFHSYKYSIVQLQTLERLNKYINKLHTLLNFFFCRWWLLQILQKLLLLFLELFMVTISFVNYHFSM